MTTSEGISTDAEVRALKAIDRTFDVRIEKAPGLFVRVHPSARKSWVLRYRNEAGDERRMPLGEYPDTKLSAAKTKAVKLKGRIADGDDPFGERSARRRELRHGDTLAQLAEAYFAASLHGTHGGRRRPRRAGSVDVDRQRFRTHIEPRLGDRPYKMLKRADVREFMSTLVEGGKLAPATVSGVGGLLRSILGYAVHLDLVDGNVALGLTSPVATEPRDRLFPDTALRTLWPALAEASVNRPRVLIRKDEPAPLRAPIEPATACGLRLLALTLLRRSELSGGRWDEIDMHARLWVIPGERMKAGRSHTVPLSEPALAVLKELRTLSSEAPSAYILPSREDPKAAMDARSLTRGLAHTLSTYKLPLGSPHDFRRSAATWLTANGVRRFVVSWLLAHAAHEGAAVTSIYDRNEYLDDRRAALELWGQHLESLTPPTATVDNVVTLKPRAKR